VIFDYKMGSPGARLQPYPPIFPPTSPEVGAVITSEASVPSMGLCTNSCAHNEAGAATNIELTSEDICLVFGQPMTFIASISCPADVNVFYCKPCTRTAMRGS
jgi:hypothetical protein